MKISYRNTLGIKIIETGFFMAETKGGADHFMIEQLRLNFKKYKDWFKPIRIISKTMSDVITTTGEKMIKDEVWDNVGEVQGSIIVNGFTYCYWIKSNNKPQHDHLVFVFFQGRIIAYMWQNVKEDKRLTIIPETEKWLIDVVQPDGQERWQETVSDSLYTTLISVINFLKYAEVQSKTIKANSKEKAIDCKYINETNSDIHFVTSDYITNLYIEGAFNVRGHWRLQPKKKDGEWTHEMIWINDFVKHGYTRKAGILNQEI